MTTLASVREETYGDTWQGDSLNRLIPALEGAGFEVVPGSLDITGLAVISPTRRRWRVSLLTPSKVAISLERGLASDHDTDDHDADTVPSDQYPILPFPGVGR